MDIQTLLEGLDGKLGYVVKFSKLVNLQKTVHLVKQQNKSMYLEMRKTSKNACQRTINITGRQISSYVSDRNSLCIIDELGKH